MQLHTLFTIIPYCVALNIYNLNSMAWTCCALLLECAEMVVAKWFARDTTPTCCITKQ